MKKTFITITGLNFHYGLDFIKRGMILKLKKEPKNEHDREAIEVKLDGLGKIGYVANSAHTVLGECHSAGYIYNKFGFTTNARVLYVLESRNAVVCELLMWLKSKTMIKNQY